MAKTKLNNGSLKKQGSTKNLKTKNNNAIQKANPKIKTKKISKNKVSLRSEKNKSTKNYKFDFITGPVEKSLVKAKSITIGSAKKFNTDTVKTVIAEKTKQIRKNSKRVLQMDKFDKILLGFAQKPYTKVINQIEIGKKVLDEERRLALELGSRILSKARKVRDSIRKSGEIKR